MQQQLDGSSAFNNYDVEGAGAFTQFAGGGVFG
jgi:hypothetical protein